MFGKAGADCLSAGEGDDYVDGGHGNDGCTAAPDNDMWPALATTAIFGDDGDDRLTGDRGFDHLAVAPARDTIFGNLDPDQIGGGPALIASTSCTAAATPCAAAGRTSSWPIRPTAWPATARTSGARSLSKPRGRTRPIRGCGSPRNFSPMQPASPSNCAAPTTAAGPPRSTTTFPTAPRARSMPGRFSVRRLAH